MRLLALALCAGLATALPTSSKTFKSSSSESESTHTSEEASYFYSNSGEQIIEITVEEAAQYDLVCVPSKELAQSAYLIVEETVHEEEEAAVSAAAGGGSAAAAAAGGGVSTSAAAGGGSAAAASSGDGSSAAAAAGEESSSAAAAGEESSSAAAAGGGSSAAAAAGEESSAAAAAGGGSSAAAAAGEESSSAAAAGGGSSATAATGAGSSAAAAAGGGSSATAAAEEESSAAVVTIYVESLTVVEDLDKCTCVPFYLCKDENIVSDGAGEIDIRFGDGSSSPVNSKCSHMSSVCCLHPELKPLPYWVQELTQEPYFPSCGHRNPSGLGFEIAGFKESESQFGEFPWMAIVLEETYSSSGELQQRYICGGSLIAKGVILTAGHCIRGKDASTLVVRLGDWNTKSLTELLPYHEHRVARTVVHEKLNRKSLFNTVALMFLEKEVEFQPHIDTICLPTLEDLAYESYDASRCVATGFGREQFNGGEYQNVMKQVDLREVEHDTCQDLLRKTRLGRWFRLHSSFTCAGGEAGVDTCRGDGGSPLVCPLVSDPNKFVQVGIVAWGIGCGQGGVPGVYASIKQLLPWILEHLHDHPGHSPEELVHEGVQVCITQNPFTDLYQEEIKIQVQEHHSEPYQQEHEVPESGY